MRCYRALSDDEKRTDWPGQSSGHFDRRDRASDRRPKSTISRELSRNKLPSRRYSPLHAAGAYQLRRRREALPRTIAPCEPGR